MLPTTAAAALVVTATGATVAESSPLTLDLSGQQTAIARTEQVADEAMVSDLASRRQASSMQTAALAGRTEAKQRAARDAQRKAAAQAKAEREGKRWVRAIRTGTITSGFGWRWGKTHDGLDIGAPTGTPLYAMSKGTVILSDIVFSFGNKVEIRYWDGTVSWYGHMSRPTSHGRHRHAGRPGRPRGQHRSLLRVRTCTSRSTPTAATTRSTPTRGSRTRASSADLAATQPAPTAPGRLASRDRSELLERGETQHEALDPSSPPKSTSACVLSPSPRVRTTVPNP